MNYPINMVMFIRKVSGLCLFMALREIPDKKSNPKWIPQIIFNQLIRYSSNQLIFPQSNSLLCRCFTIGWFSGLSSLGSSSRVR